jgi:hypothetical protein
MPSMFIRVEVDPQAALLSVMLSGHHRLAWLSRSPRSHLGWGWRPRVGKGQPQGSVD